MNRIDTHSKHMKLFKLFLFSWIPAFVSAHQSGIPAFVSANQSGIPAFVSAHQRWIHARQVQMKNCVIRIPLDYRSVQIEAIEHIMFFSIRGNKSQAMNIKSLKYSQRSNKSKKSIYFRIDFGQYMHLKISLNFSYEIDNSDLV